MVFQIGFKAVQRSVLCRSRQELSNTYLVAKIGFDPAENGPLKVGQQLGPRRMSIGSRRPVDPSPAGGPGQRQPTVMG